MTPEAVIDTASTEGKPLQTQANIRDAFIEPPQQDAFSPVEPFPSGAQDEDAASEFEIPPNPIYRDEEDVSNPVWWTGIPQAARLALLINNAKLRSRKTSSEILQEYTSRLKQTEEFFETKLQEIVGVFDKAFNVSPPQRQKPKLDNVDLLGLVVAALAGGNIGDATKMILDKKEEEADRQYQLDLANWEIENRQAKEKANLMLSLLQRRVESNKDILEAQMKAELAGVEEEEKRKLIEKDKSTKALSMLLAAQGPEEVALVIEMFGIDVNNPTIKRLLERKEKEQQAKDLALQQEAERITIELGGARQRLEHQKELLPLDLEIKKLALEAAKVGLTADELNKDILAARSKYIDRELAAQTATAELEYELLKRQLSAANITGAGAQTMTPQERLMLNSTFTALDNMLKRNEEQLSKQANSLKGSMPKSPLSLFASIPKFIELKQIEDAIKKLREYRDKLTLDYVGALGGRLSFPAIEKESATQPTPKTAAPQKGQGKGFLHKGKTPSGFEYQYKTSVAGDEVSMAAPFADTIATQYKGKPYIWGGVTEKGVDCSGLVMQYANMMGLKFPYRFTTAELYKNEMGWVAVNKNQLAKGDIIVYRAGGKGHTGIYMGSGKVLDASSANKKVVERSFASAFGNKRNLRFYRPPVGVV